MVDSVLLPAEMDGEKDFKVDSYFPLFNDLLAFLWSKTNESPRDTLLNVMKAFYKADDIIKAEDLFFGKLPDRNFEKLNIAKWRTL